MKEKNVQLSKHIEGKEVAYPGWMKVTANLPGRGFQTASHLVLWAKFQRRSKGQPFEYSAIRCASDFGISRGAASAGLRLLEKLGLIRITNQRGKPGLVVFEEVPEKWDLSLKESKGKSQTPFFDRESSKESAASTKESVGGDVE